jgi:hypothetical protein
MADPLALQRILQRLVQEGSNGTKLPDCPECGRHVKVGFEVRKNALPASASIWLWCSSCTQVAVAFGVTPPPAWLGGGSKTEVESSGG